MVFALDIQDPALNPVAKFSDLSKILNVIFPLITIGASLVFFVMLIRASYMWLMSEGSPETIAKAQKMFLWSMVGLVVVIASYVFVKLIGVILNIQFPI